MTRDHDRRGSIPSATARTRALDAVMGLCLAARPDVADRPPELQDFTVQPEPEAVLLTWTLAPILSFSRFAIRFNVDGPAPSSPQEGFALFCAPTSPGSSYRALHARLSPAHAYSYAAFGLDESGAVVASATAVAIPSSPYGSSGEAKP